MAQVLSKSGDALKRAPTQMKNSELAAR